MRVYTLGVLELSTRFRGGQNFFIFMSLLIATTRSADGDLNAGAWPNKVAPGLRPTKGSPAALAAQIAAVVGVGLGIAACACPAWELFEIRHTRTASRRPERGVEEEAKRQVDASYATYLAPHVPLCVWGIA